MVEVMVTDGCVKAEVMVAALDGCVYVRSVHT